MPEQNQRQIMNEFEHGNVVVHSMSHWQKMIQENPNMTMAYKPWNAAAKRPELNAQHIEISR